MPIITGSFISVWEQGIIQTEGTLDTETGEVTCKVVDTGDLGYLDREYFEDKDGKEYEICTTCHEFTLKTVMVPDDVGIGLSQEMVCSNPNCE